jgi:COP9 signalosome complex subunit 5
MSSSTALQSFSLANDIFTLSPQDEIYRFDVEANKRINRDAPWDKEFVSSLSAFFEITSQLFEYRPHYFKSCKISAVALIKMVRSLRPRRTSEHDLLIMFIGHPC